MPRLLVREPQRDMGSHAGRFLRRSIVTNPLRVGQTEVHVPSQSQKVTRDEVISNEAMEAQPVRKLWWGRQVATGSYAHNPLACLLVFPNAPEPSLPLPVKYDGMRSADTGYSEKNIRESPS